MWQIIIIVIEYILRYFCVPIFNILKKSIGWTHFNISILPHLILNIFGRIYKEMLKNLGFVNAKAITFINKLPILSKVNSIPKGTYLRYYFFL